MAAGEVLPGIVARSFLVYDQSGVSLRSHANRMSWYVHVDGTHRPCRLLHVHQQR